MFLNQRRTDQSFFSSNNCLGRKLRMEVLEPKTVLAGNVMANLVGGDLFITGDGDDNSILITPAVDETSQLNITGLFGTSVTVNGGPPTTVSVLGDVFIDYSGGGNNETFFGAGGDSIVLPGSISITGSADDDNHFVTNTTVNGDVTAVDTAGGAVGTLGINQGSQVTGDVTWTTSAENIELIVSDATIDGNLTFSSANDTASTAFFILENNAEIVGDLVLNGGDGLDSFTLEQSSATIGDDLRINAGGSDDEIVLLDISVDDDFVFNGGEGNDLLEMEVEGATNMVGDDAYISGEGGDDELIIIGANIADKLRVSGNAGDDTVELSEIIVGRTALISLGEGLLDVANVTDLSGARGLTVLGAGTSNIRLTNVMTSHYVDVLTSSGDDQVVLTNVNTSSAWIATFEGMDQVSITASEVDSLFVLLGDGDDILTLNDVTVNRVGFLHGGEGEDTLIDIGDASEIRFELDFAFENYGV